ncbi:MAG: polyprenyl synthetase family protein [Alphaproteobacteria bacterium]|nr:polyprenyl synthetase family protein [Alphaproteobacteria bacterium]
MVKVIEEMKNFHKTINAELDKLLPQPNTPEKELVEAMRYAAIADGKTIRAYILVKVAEMFDVPLEKSLRVAAALEMIHTSSLVHDDMPIMDNDDLRRGKPTCHRAYNDWTALLVGDALLIRAFNVIASANTVLDPAVRCELITELSRVSGMNGRMAGQMLDMVSETKDDIKLIDVKHMQELKSSRLFEFACEAGAIMGKADFAARQALRSYATHLGILFQITDDLLDVESSVEETGKDVRKDVQASKASYVSFVGVEKAFQYAKQEMEQALLALCHFGKEADFLRELAQIVLKRRK